jgi:hypothetical protein
VFHTAGRCLRSQAFNKCVGVDGEALFEYICPCVFKLGRDCYSRLLLDQTRKQHCKILLLFYVFIVLKTNNSLYWFWCTFLLCRYTWLFRDFIINNNLLALSYYWIGLKAKCIYIERKATERGYKQTKQSHSWFSRIELYSWLRIASLQLNNIFSNRIIGDIF